MKNQIRLIIVLLFGTIFLISNGYSQSIFRINDEIGSGGNANTNQSNSSDNTALYVVGGLAVAGIIAYAVISKSNKKNEEEKADTSSALQQSGRVDLASRIDEFEYEFKKVQDKIPVNLILGVRNDNAFVSDKTYLMGVSVRF